MNTSIIAFALVLIAASGDSFACASYYSTIPCTDNSYSNMRAQQLEQQEVYAQQRQAQAMERQNQIMQNQYNQQNQYRYMDRARESSNNLNYMIANPYRRGY